MIDLSPIYVLEAFRREGSESYISAIALHTFSWQAIQRFTGTRGLDFHKDMATSVYDSGCGTVWMVVERISCPVTTKVTYAAWDSSRVVQRSTDWAKWAAMCKLTQFKLYESIIYLEFEYKSTLVSRLKNKACRIVQASFVWQYPSM